MKTEDLNNLTYWQTSMSELMNAFSNAPLNPPNENKIPDRVASCNLKTYGESYNLVELEEWIRGMEKIFIIIEVPEEKGVNIGIFYLTREAGIS